MDSFTRLSRLGCDLGNVREHAAGAFNCWGSRGSGGSPVASIVDESAQVKARFCRGWSLPRTDTLTGPGTGRTDRLDVIVSSRGPGVRAMPTEWLVTAPTTA
jgi:hypothetical protein